MSSVLRIVAVSQRRLLDKEIFLCRGDPVQKMPLRSRISRKENETHLRIVIVCQNIAMIVRLCDIKDASHV
jgi:hypothetical protein